MELTRRDLGKLALASVPGAMLGATSVAHAAQAGRKPNSIFGGVQIGVIAPYSFMSEATDLDAIVKAVTQLGISAVELQSQPLEAFAGAPAATGGARGGAARGRGAAPAARGGAAPAPPAPSAAPSNQPPPPPVRFPQLTAEQQTAATALRTWRLAQAMTKFRDARKRFDDAGVTIQVVKFDLGPNMSDEEVDYAFQVAKAVGARALTCEPPVGESKRLGLFADKHKLMLGFHGHSDVTSVEAFGRPGLVEQAFFYSAFNGANVDIGHFTAGNNRSALAFIREHHSRITNIHLSDRRTHQGPSVPWGEGDAEIREILLLMKREGYPFQATIELEYPVPDGSTRMAELAKCVSFCRDALA